MISRFSQYWAVVSATCNFRKIQFSVEWLAGCYTANCDDRTYTTLCPKSPSVRGFVASLPVHLLFKYVENNAFTRVRQFKCRIAAMPRPVRTFWWRFCVVNLPLLHFCWYKSICHRTESDLFLFSFKHIHFYQARILCFVVENFGSVMVGIWNMTVIVMYQIPTMTVATQLV